LITERQGGGKSSVVDDNKWVIPFPEDWEHKLIFPMESITENDHVNWAINETSKKLPITMQSFAKAFNYFDQDDADSAFTQLLSSTNIPKGNREAAMSNYMIWKRNNGDSYWAHRVALSKTKLSKKRTAAEQRKRNGNPTSDRLPKKRRASPERNVPVPTSPPTSDATAIPPSPFVGPSYPSNVDSSLFEVSDSEDESNEGGNSPCEVQLVRKVGKTDIGYGFLMLRGFGAAAILDRVFQSSSYNGVAEAVRSEDMRDPVAAYLMTIVMAYYQYFSFGCDVPKDINEREGFTGMTWVFMHTPLTMYGVKTRYSEVLIKGVDERKNQDKNLLLESKDSGQFADAVATHNRQQLLLVEASQLHHTDAKKSQEDEFKLIRAMRDSWISQVRTISKLTVPHRGLAVFGCACHKDEVKVMKFDYQGVFRAIQLDHFIVPLRKEDFSIKAKTAVISCLQLAAHIQDEIENRNKIQNTLDYKTRAMLANAVLKIEKTTSTPTGIKRRKSTL
ncbi:hypothetical protein BGZ46_002941, partial [Entomortierella lignicola]